MVLRSVFLAALPLFGFSLAQAQNEVFQMDPAKSQVQFSLQATLHPVHGTFQVQSGAIHFGTADGTMGGTVLVDAHSGNSGEASRDKKMTQDQLKADQFTQVTFAPKSFTGHLATEGDSDIVVQGTFTLLGTPHDLLVPMHVHADHGTLKTTGTFTVPFVKWGMKDPSTFLLKVGKDVTVTLDLAGTVASEKAR